MTRIALLEIDISDSVSIENRLLQSRELIQKSIDLNCELIIFPELWLGSAHNVDLMLMSEEVLWFQFLTEVQDLCARHNIYVHCGSAAIKYEGVRNRSFFVEPNRRVSYYDKRKIFGFGFGESLLIGGGEDDCVSRFKTSKIAMFTCYDLRFPELFRSSLGKGMEVAIICAAWPKSRLDHWTNLLCARAIENQVFVIGCNGVGVQGNIEIGGGSMIFSPEGELVVTQTACSSLLVGEINLEEVYKTRDNFPVLKDR